MKCLAFGNTVEEEVLDIAMMISGRRMQIESSKSITTGMIRARRWNGTNKDSDRGIQQSRFAVRCQKIYGCGL